MFHKHKFYFSDVFDRNFFFYLQVTMTCMRAWMSSKFGWIRPWTTELAALQRMKNPNILIIGKTMSSHFLQYFTSPESKAHR